MSAYVIGLGHPDYPPTPVIAAAELVRRWMAEHNCTSLCGLKLDDAYVMPGAHHVVPDITDAERWRAFRDRDRYRDLEATYFLDCFREDADVLIDAAIREGYE